MARDRLSSDYSEIMSDSTSCSCMTSSIDKCSVRSCGMFQEPFFLHPPGSRPRDGLYINPMSASFSPSPARLHGPVKDNNNQQQQQQPSSLSTNGNSESFYLHSPHDLVYTRITHLFDEGSPPILERASSRSSAEAKDETLTVKVDVHMNNGTFKPMVNGSASSLRSELAKDSGSEHAYEQICIRQDEQASPKYAASHKKLDDASDASRSRRADRRYSRSSTASESSCNLSSEVHCYSSTTSTPSLSRNSSNERMSKSPKVPDALTERKNSTTSSTRTELEKETKTGAVNGPSIFRPPPPPPPPPPEIEEVVIVTTKVVESSVREEKRDGSQSSTQEQKCEATITTISATNKSALQEDAATSCGGGGGGESAEVPVGTSPPAAIGNCSIADDEQQRVPGAASTTTTTTTTTACQVTAHLVNRHMVLPFIPPKFASQAADSDTLLKPSEYLRSICKAAPTASTGSLSKARSLDNLDCQGRGASSEEEAQKSEPEEQQELQQKRDPSSGPPPPPLPPPPINGIGTSLQSSTSSTADTPRQTQQQQQPLATISIQDLTSVQLRRTNVKMHATKTFSAPPNRSVSMTNVSEAFFVQKTDLIAELKKTKDIPGIKKLKVQRAQVEKSQEQNLISEISKAFSASNFVDQIPEKDSSGNVIPIWKRQMLARKAAERAKKELEEQIARENEEKRQKAIPPWKRQLLAKKDSEGKITSGPTAVTQSMSVPLTSSVSPKIEVPVFPKKEPVLEIPPPPAISVPVTPSKPLEESTKPVVVQYEEKRNESNDDTDNVHIIPWRAQLRKTNSKLNILD